MATVINNPTGTTDSGASITAVIIGIVAAALILFFVFGGMHLFTRSTAGPSISVPVNVTTPGNGGTSAGASGSTGSGGTGGGGATSGY